MMLKSALDVKDTSYTRALLRNAEVPVSPQQLITDFRSRQMRPAYQEMLVSDLPLAS
jgi:ATP-dependent RNA helicase DHX29